MVGTYSSIFIAAPILIYLGVKTGGGSDKDEPTAKAAKTPAKAAA